jgi:hypothetical protein
MEIVSISTKIKKVNKLIGKNCPKDEILLKSGHVIF